MKFGYTIIYVPEVERALSFYEKAFGFKRKFVAPGNEYGELDTGATTLAFAAYSLVKQILPEGFQESDPAKKPFGVEVAFVTNDVEKDYKKAVAAGAMELAKPEEKPWGQTVSYVRDIHGYVIEICTPA